MLATPRDAKYVDFIEKLTGNKLARRQMTDIEVRDDRGPRREERRGGRDRGRRDKRGHDRRPPGGKFHDHVAPTEPVREAQVEASRPNPAIVDAPKPERAHKPHPEKKHKDKPHGRHGAPAKETVDHSQLPAFLFRKVPAAKREPQDG
jgi:hypothetical protein